MTHINTVLGPIAPADLGFTLMHEHVMVSASGLYEPRSRCCLSTIRGASSAAVHDVSSF
jgi:predicted metal-dependent phosphotriesterase family hydrolase